MAKVVVALGGNALGNTPSEQRQKVALTAKVISDLTTQGHVVLLCHGNGPQVGMINNAFQSAYLKQEIPEAMPFAECGAMSQGYIGYHIQNALHNQFARAKISRPVVTLITQTFVDSQDPAFQNPSKPIGTFLSQSEAEKLAKANGWDVKEDAGRGWRRVVASPIPRAIVEKELIETLVAHKAVVIAGGGGGIPVALEKGQLVGKAAVIDKDLTAALLAQIIKADKLVILTAVSAVKINYQKDNEKDLTTVSVKELKTYVGQKQFAVGSMLPKIEAALQFVTKTGQPAYIGNLTDAAQIIAGKAGTKIVAN
ncbi:MULTISPECIES: carbamate kinase [unclassified Mycoplasma]|uniref:carbamate kinase n=1 Tax=unclassified Mycoplasma TaxID=2683645 RepID=UPI000FDD1268